MCVCLYVYECMHMCVYVCICIYNMKLFIYKNRLTLSILLGNLLP